MKIAITGVSNKGTGSLLVRALEEKGHKVVKLTDNPDVVLITLGTSSTLDRIKDIRSINSNARVIGLRYEVGEIHQMRAKTLIDQGYPVINNGGWIWESDKANQVATELERILQGQPG